MHLTASLPIPTVQSSKLPDECGACTIRNSSVAIKRWLLVKPELLWSYYSFRYIYIYTGTLTCIVKFLDEVCASHSKRVGDNKGGFPLSRNFCSCTCTCVKFTSANKTGAMHEMLHVSIKVDLGHV